MDETRSHEYFIKRATCSDNNMSEEIMFAAEHHINSFNCIYEDGLANICKHLNPIEISNQEENLKNVPFSKMRICAPYKQGEIGVSDPRIFPSECRIKGKTYCAPFLATIAREIDDEIAERTTISLGDIPIMIKSKNCHLSQLSPDELVEAKEDCTEFGGYFIVNGIEKVVRMLVMTKRNYPVAFCRPSYVNKGVNFTPFALQMRCVREDMYSKTITLHYINDGDVCLRILHKKQEVMIPIAVILKSLIECSDQTIFNKIVYRGDMKESIISDRVEVMLRSCLKLGLGSRIGCLKYLGSNFRVALSGLPFDATDEEIGEIFLRENICVNLSSFRDKFDSLCLMISKLYALVTDKINPDNLDALVNHEVLLPGHLCMMIIREYLEESLQFFKVKFIKDSTKQSELSKMRNINYFRKAIDFKGSLGKRLEAFLATGNVKSSSGLDLMQSKGFVVVADKLNSMRFLAHFRSIHRGAYFTEMKTTTVRKLLPDNWGFICPVHTPDGSPCGLLNHISSTCKILTESFNELTERDLMAICSDLGMIPNTSLNLDLPDNCLPIVLDGKVFGFVSNDLAETFTNSLRKCKIDQKDTQDRSIPELKYLEIAHIPINEHSDKNAMYPMIFLSTTDSRLLRPVKHLKSNKIELISPLEQVNLSIAVVENDIRKDTRYQELLPASMLSILARNIPFLEHNQSPRNMYQCQMAKQTLGTASHNLPYRFDNKSYRLYSPQLPLVKPSIYENYGFAETPSGTNAVVAVISYTGYDMEDAMIINKSSYERGFAHGCVYKTVEHELGDGRKTKYSLVKDSQNDKRLAEFQSDGMPKIGTSMKKGSPELALHDLSRNSVRIYNYKDNEKAKIDQIAFITNEDNENESKILYKLRIPRNPVIGDKFSSRHGQKGVLSILWPQIDMPFTESGMTPDIIINPNAFPSRMTIGMLIESMAGKVGALKGKIQETEPFVTYENGDIFEHYGNQLVKAGYNYYGSEMMYSGIYGTPLKADIYFGVVYYQRLRHMVSDKSQARATGPVDVLTQQPVKGRKKHGGIRMGEMERDALLSHGSSYILHERLLLSSDYSESYICSGCGSMLSTFVEASISMDDCLDMHSDGVMIKSKPTCKNCNKGQCVKVGMPFVLRYLANELASMNIKMRFFVK